MDKFDHKNIEAKWQRKWAEENIYKTPSVSLGVGGDDSSRPKYYVLDMFPYPSGTGLHVGHVKGYSATDVLARMKRMQGFNVLHPMGWDAFGLPAENFAIKNKTHPKIQTEKNISYFKEQMRGLGFSYDWEREINTTDPEYYKWSQWAFIKMWEKGLAYESWEPIIWCPKCQTGLAMEDLEDGKCERCESEVERKPMRQWVIKITKYADRLLDDLDKLPGWEESIKEMQRNWIGRSEGAEIEFQIKNKKEKIKVFTTRPDTLFGVTYVVLAPENPMVENWKLEIRNWDEVENYIKKTKAKSDLERTDLNKDKSGVKLEGVMAVNPANGEEVPVFIADYVLANYSTGAVMAVPAHDERDADFARKYSLPIKIVVEPEFGEKKTEEVRKRIIALVYDSKNEKILTLNWGEKFGGYLLVGGGVEQGEDLEGAARREVLEEAGYENIKLLEQSEKIHHHYFAFNKNINRNTEMVGLFFELIDDKKIEQKLSSEEMGKFSVEWISAKEAAEKIKDPCHFYLFNKFINKKVFVDEGISANSDFLNGLPTIEAKKKMIEWLEKEGKGKKKVNYKLNDWVFSRQRYWGEPIPFVHCENCKKEIEDGARVINFYNQDTWERLISGQKTIETRALNPDEPDKFFGDVKEGWYLKAVNKIKNEIKYFEVKKAWQFKNLSELLANKEVLQKVVAPKLLPASLDELEEMYSFVPDYVERINKNGLVAWEVRMISPGVIAVPEKDLPVRLPDVEHYEPTGTGESPLANIADWVNTACPKCGGNAKRETNTMPQWAGSSWYYLRYIDPKNSEALVAKDKEKYWSPVDFYVGGAEHATRHLIYARFWHKFLFDIGVVNFEEPFTALQHVGLVLGSDGKKISKRLNNGANPLDVAAEYGADALRIYENFMGPFNQPCAWSNTGPLGVRRFLDKVWSLSEKLSAESPKEIQNILHKTIKKITEDIADFKLNTCVSALMICANAIEEKGIGKEDFAKFIEIIAPFAPHLAEEIWEKLGNHESIFKSAWPKFDSELIKDETVNLVVQINGKLRATISVSSGVTQDEAMNFARENENVKKWLEGKEIVKIIFVAGKLLNIVVR